MVFGETVEEPTLVSSDDRVAAAAAALLIEAAAMDGSFDADEHGVISTLLSERFDLDSDAVMAIIERAEVAVSQSVELFSVTRVLRDDFEHIDRVRMIEMLWEVVYADGILHDFEANLVRRVCGLLHVSDRESGDARKKVVSRLDMEAGAA
jgi:uncharacterized tellurite resistance protein B-like protein